MYTFNNDPCTPIRADYHIFMVTDELELVGQFQLSCVSLVCCQYVQAICIVLEGYSAKINF